MNGYDQYGYTYNDMMPFNNESLGLNNMTEYNYEYNQIPSNQSMNNGLYNQMNNNLNNQSVNSNVYSGMDNNYMTNSNKNLADPYEGYIRGNIFNNLYEQYKNYQPERLIANDEREEMLLNLNKLSFFVHDLRLYLDNYPNDKEMLKLFNKYRGMANDALYNYEQQYGPITWDSFTNNNEFGWAVTTWPWEKGVM